MENRTADVLIVGAGPTGLMMANLLKLQNISFRIIDKKEGATELSKALGVQPRTLELFEQIGLSIEGMPVTSAHLHANKEEIAVVDFTKIDSKYKHVTIFPQSDMEKLLIGKLEKAEKKIAWKTELVDIQPLKDGAEVRLAYADGRIQTEQYTWVVGCDGAHSSVRHKMNVSFGGSEDKMCFGLADVEIDGEVPQDQIITNIAKAGLFACFPLPNGKFRLVVDRLSDPDNELTPNDWEILFNDRSPVAGKIKAIDWQSKFYINYRLARHFKQGHLLLAGDAA
ncbi:MAG: FAD-dependent monooxygenase, partial [Simkaniaceae bacterium]|nr:FAD-dependent monooxygenase [Simkaniaceae bacterium]